MQFVAKKKKSYTVDRVWRQLCQVRCPLMEMEGEVMARYGEGRGGRQRFV